MGAAARANEQAVALRVIARIPGIFAHAHQAAVTVLAHPGRYAFGHNPAFGTLPQMNHLGAGVGLLMIVGNGHRVEFRRGKIAF